MTLVKHDTDPVAKAPPEVPPPKYVIEPSQKPPKPVFPFLGWASETYALIMAELAMLDDLNKRIEVRKAQLKAEQELYPARGSTVWALGYNRRESEIAAGVDPAKITEDGYELTADVRKIKEADIIQRKKDANVILAGAFV